jgi:hypothetical protein
LVYLLHGMGCSWAVQLCSIARRIQEAHDITSYLKLVDKRLVHCRSCMLLLMQDDMEWHL